ncbi:MAG: type II secretion system protein [Candidatus Sericytochromatia bacterium]|nr:type II secretion system protein [Candidatus Sericytochromatia bacterium]
MAVRPTGGRERRAQRRGARAGFSMLELVVVSAVVGTLAGMGLTTFEVAKDRARNTAMMANVKVVQVALEQYAGDHDGTYPPSADPRDPARTYEVPTASHLGLGTYLPGRRFPASPWGQAGSGAPSALRALCEPGGAPLNSAVDVGAGEGIIKRAGTVIGPGRVYPLVSAGQGPWPRTAYGNLIYSRDPEHGIVLVYGVGKKRQDAVVVAGFCNDGATAGALGAYQAP